MRRTRPDRLVLATNNAHKVKEIRAILRRAGLPMRVLTLLDFPKAKPVVENRRTIEGNAIKKAKEVARRTGCLALADDTGLFIKALRGQPGVYSARFAGPGCTFEDNNRKVLRLLRKVPVSGRGADFRCIAALADPAGRAAHVEGRISGRIADQTHGSAGFGYDPIFYVPRLKRTFAQITRREKNSISHRARAFRQVPGLLRRFLKTGKVRRPR